MRILYVASCDGAVKYYRGIGPLERLRDIGDVEIIYPMKDRYASVMAADVVFFLRTTDTESMLIAEMAHILNKPIWYDLDDDFLAVNPDSGAALHYARPDVRHRFERFLAVANVRSFSTKALYDKYKRGDQDQVFPNALDFDFITPRPFNENSSTFLWRGGATHQADLMHYTESILGGISAVNPIVFAGYNPFWLTEGRENRTKYIPYQPFYPAYIRDLQEIAPMAVVVPLVDNEFNRGKSNIAALEAIVAGAIPIVPDFPEWEIPGSFKYYTEHDRSIKSAMNVVATAHKKELSLRHRTALKWVQENASLSVVNISRLLLLGELL